MKEAIFKFKKFNCRHDKASMKIGVDAVLLGAWAGDGTATRVLDVGTGCGVIALMMAQRNPEAHILAIDIDEASVAEAAENFSASVWHDRMNAVNVDFNELVDGENRFDLIVSNPPYFDSGLKNPETRREVARHQDRLSPTELVNKSGKILSDGGKLAIVLPADQTDTLLTETKESGLKVARVLDIQGNLKAPVKRTLLEFIKSEAEVKMSRGDLILELEPGKPTPEHYDLCKDFYLKW